MDQDADTTKRSGDTPHRGYRPFLLVVLFLSLYLSYLVLNPFLHTLILAIVLSSMLYPLHVRLARLYRGRQNLAAFSIVFLFTFVVAIPVFFFVSSLVTQGFDTVNQINDWLKTGNLQNLAENPRVVSTLTWLHERFPYLQFERLNIQGYLLQGSKNLGQLVLSNLARVVGNVASLLTHFFVMIFVMFYLVRDGRRMVEQVRYFSPLREDQEDRLLDGVRRVARSVLMGSFVTALLQGFFGGMALSLVGFPGLFWGTVMAFAAFIPIVGTALIWVPASLYLFLLGSSKAAIFLAAWSIVVVGSIDNFLRPFLMRGEANLSPFYIFLAIIGGVNYFGLIGVLYGPLILTFAMVMLYIYGSEYQKDLLAGKHGKPTMIGSDEEVPSA